jgi:sugar (pentulose or hexulose) kinase
MISEMTGTTMAVSALTDKIPEYKKGLKVPCHYISRGKFCLIMWSSTSGMALEWFRNTFCPGMSYKEIDKMCEDVPQAAVDLWSALPLRFNHAKIQSEMRDSFYGIELFHTRAHLREA